MIIKFSVQIFFIIILCYLTFYKLLNVLMPQKFISKNKVIDFCLFLSLLFIVSQTLFPIDFTHKFQGFEIYNLVPFKVVIDIFINYNLLYFTHQVFGNIVLFIPYGFFMFIKTNKNTKKTILLILFTTIAIEFIQGFIPYRFCEIDDIWLNTLGGYIGILITKTINKGHIKL